MGVNPIRAAYYGEVTNRTTYTPSKTFSTVPCPSVFEYELSDVSGDDAGRTEDVVMDKKRIGQAVKVKLAWNNVETSIASTVLQIFNEEYVIVDYLDPMVGDFVKKEFYVGNRSTPLYNASMGVWSKISFDLIERDAGYIYDPYLTASDNGTSVTGWWVNQIDNSVKYPKTGLKQAAQQL